MVGRKFALLFVMFLISSNFVYAQEERLHEQNTLYHYKEGIKAELSNNLPIAYENFQKTLLLAPHDPDWRKCALNGMGVVYARQGDLDNAELYFNEVLKIDPDYKIAEINLGFVYEQKGMSKLECLEYWAKVFELDRLKPKTFVLDQTPLEVEQEKKKILK